MSSKRSSVESEIVSVQWNSFSYVHRFSFQIYCRISSKAPESIHGYWYAKNDLQCKFFSVRISNKFLWFRKVFIMTVIVGKSTPSRQYLGQKIVLNNVCWYILFSPYYLNTRTLHRNTEEKILLEHIYDCHAPISIGKELRLS